MGGKSYSSLIIEIVTAESANRLINEEVIEGHIIKNCELFDKNCRITQCFVCQQYGHTGKVCRNGPICGFCSRGHNSRDCKLRSSEFRPRCAVCKTDGHET